MNRATVAWQTKFGMSEASAMVPPRISTQKMSTNTVAHSEQTHRDEPKRPHDQK
jgi:hypothetical protein